MACGKRARLSAPYLLSLPPLFIPDSFCPQLTPTSYPIYGLVASQLGDVDTPTLLPDGVRG